jgi:hypothetical protein
MKPDGRFDSAAGRCLHSPHILASSGLLESRALTGHAACVLAVLTIALLAKFSSRGLVVSDSEAAEQPGTSANTTEIPPAVSLSAAERTQPVTSDQISPNQLEGVAPGQTTGPAEYSDGVINYERAKSTELNGPPLGSLEDFMSEGDLTSPLGFRVREDKRRLKHGGEAQGLLITEVFAGSPAARAGLRPYRRTLRDVLETAAVAGALFMPPAVLLVPVFDQVRVGETYDLIIGVDGSRVTDLLDFQDRMRDVQPGEIVYFTVIRNGERMQIPVPVPRDFSNSTF